MDHQFIVYLKKRLARINEDYEKFGGSPARDLGLMAIILRDNPDLRKILGYDS